MARIVILSFEDNKLADSYVRQVVTDGYAWQLPPTKSDPNSDITWVRPNEGRRVDCTVEAVVARPTRWCRCAVPEIRGRRRGKRESGWTRSLHFGWTVCVHCNKPSAAVVRHFVSIMLVGANDLLPEILRLGNPISPHNRWLRDGGTENDYLRGLETPRGKTREHV